MHHEYAYNETCVVRENASMVSLHAMNHILLYILSLSSVDYSQAVDSVDAIILISLQ